MESVSLSYGSSMTYSSDKTSNNQENHTSLKFTITNVLMSYAIS